jgi:hypothetical protein
MKKYPIVALVLGGLFFAGIVLSYVPIIDITGIMNLNSSNIATNGIQAFNLSSNAVEQSNIDPLTGIIYFQYIRAPDGIISNTVNLMNLFTVTQSTTNVPLGSKSQQSLIDFDILYNNGSGSSVTYSNIAIYTNDSPWEKYPAVVVQPNSGLMQHYSQTYDRLSGASLTNCNANFFAQMGTASPGITMELIGCRIYSVVHLFP